VLFNISKDRVGAIKRIMTTQSYIVNTENEGVKVLSIDDLKSKQFSYKVFLETEKLEKYRLLSDSLQL
jgi:hypothetical protein